MRSFLSGIISFLLVTVAIAADSSSDFPTVEVSGNKFYYSNNGSQFLIRGIAYQQNTANETDLNFKDPLADADACKRDVQYFQELNTNVLRVYAINTSLDHDECMETFQNAGIYIIADLSEPTLSINRDSPEWNLDLYERYTDVVDAMANYSNTLGFFAGNEVTNNKSNTDASAFVKAAVRDTKKYISDKNYRSIPVGYSSNDDADTRIAIADYFACGEVDERADFFGINMYEWCGDSSFEKSGYEDRTKEYSNLTIPVFFSEYGCIEKRPRKFTEVGTIFSDDMTDVWSGGIVYMYFEEENNYGLISLDGSSVKTLSDFSYYSQEINSISPSYAKKSSATVASTQTLSCPGNSSPTWKASSKLPPTPDKDICDCMAESLQCTVDDSVKEEDYVDLYSYICANIGCGGISSNGSIGHYGAFSFCSDKDKLSYVLNEYYLQNNKDASACDFSGSATLNTKASAKSECSSKVSSAASQASSQASSTDATNDSSSDSSESSSSGSSSSSTGSSTASSTSTKSSDASAVQVPMTKLYAVAGVITFCVGGASLLFV